MTTKVSVIDIGDDIGIELSAEILQRLNVTIGDTLYLTETPSGIQLSTVNPDSLHPIHRIAEENRDVLKKLADS